MPLFPAAVKQVRRRCTIDPRRKRRIRLTAALAAATVLLAALAYTSFSAASPARTPSQLLRSAVPGHSYELTGIVVPGYRRAGDVLLFRVRDRRGGGSVPVRYSGSVPDPFRAGREIIVSVRERAGAFIGERDSLVTKCPSKFKAQAPA